MTAFCFVHLFFDFKFCDVTNIKKQHRIMGIKRGSKEIGA